MVNRVVAVEYIRRMRGGTQAHLLGCSDGERYVVKFQNNPQGTKILANEMLATALAKQLDLPTAETAVVDATEILGRHPNEMTIQLGRASFQCSSGLCFGSHYPSDGDQPKTRALMRVYDLIPNTPELRIVNVADFSGMLVFDKWTCNTDGRQVIFVRSEKAWEYKALMIDNGFCFNAGEWNFPDAPLRGLYVRPFVYQSVTGLESFEPWLELLKKKMDRQFLEQQANDVPAEWYAGDQDSMMRLLDQLERRRNRVEELLLAAWRARPLSFPNWPYKAPQFLMNFGSDLLEHERSKAKTA
jgi:HipA-like kinase